MDNYVIIVFACLALNLILIFTRQSFKSKILSFIFKALLSVGVIKYISLLIFYTVDSPKFLYEIKTMPMLSLISIFAIGYIMISHIVEKSMNKFDVVFLIFIFLIGGYIIYNTCIGIINSELGYILIKNQEWIYIEAIFTVIVSIILVVKSLKALVDTRINKKRVCLILIAVSFISISVEEGLIVLGKELFHFNIVADLICIIATILVLLIKRKKKEQL